MKSLVRRQPACRHVDLVEPQNLANAGCTASFFHAAHLELEVLDALAQALLGEVGAPIPFRNGPRHVDQCLGVLSGREDIDHLVRGRVITSTVSDFCSET